MITSLKPFNVTIVVFDPAHGPDGGTRYVLPVDSPDAEQACASTLANAASFTERTRDGKAHSVAFMAIDVRERS